MDNQILLHRQVSTDKIFKIIVMFVFRGISRLFQTVQEDGVSPVAELIRIHARMNRLQDAPSSD